MAHAMQSANNSVHNAAFSLLRGLKSSKSSNALFTNDNRIELEIGKEDELF